MKSAPERLIKAFANMNWLNWISLFIAGIIIVAGLMYMARNKE